MNAIGSSSKILNTQDTCFSFFAEQPRYGRLHPLLSGPRQSDLLDDIVLRLVLEIADSDIGLPDFPDVLVEVLEEVHDDVEDGHSDEQTGESEELLRNDQYEEGQRDRQLGVVRHDPRIEVVGFDHVDHHDHGQDLDHDRHSSERIPDHDHRHGRKEHPEDRDHSEDEDDDGEREDEGEWEFVVDEGDEIE